MFEFPSNGWRFRATIIAQTRCAQRHSQTRSAPFLL
jgi:hypothetical protein